jgi:hypothetical protein
MLQGDGSRLGGGKAEVGLFGIGKARVAILGQPQPGTDRSWVLCFVRVHQVLINGILSFRAKREIPQGLKFLQRIARIIQIYKPFFVKFVSFVADFNPLFGQLRKSYYFFLLIL